VLPPDPPAGLSPAGLLRWAVDTLHEDAQGRPVVLAIDDPCRSHSPCRTRRESS
jgi:hypothetical protein